MARARLFSMAHRLAGESRLVYTHGLAAGSVEAAAVDTVISIFGRIHLDSAVERFEMRITIDPGDIDQMGHVNNVVYLRWVQDVAVAHWLAAAPTVDLDKLLWVVIRHEIDYKQPAFLGDEIIARTWVGTATRLPTASGPRSLCAAPAC